MKVLVCGGRDFDRAGDLHRVLNALHAVRPITLLIHGSARGADSIAGHWANSHQVPVKEYPANWGKYGRSAGPIRNTQMLQESRPDLVVAFPGGRGTAHMVAVSKEAGIAVVDAGIWLADTP